MKLVELTADLLNQAVTIYLEKAYSVQSDRDSKRVTFEADMSSDALLKRFDDETELTPDAHHFLSLRLGSEAYPHMKLSLWEAFYHGQYVFTVDAHDGFSFDSSAPDYQEWLELKNHNRLCKLSIEDSWYGAGLPTMRLLKEKSLSRSDYIRAYRGYHVLLVDDDSDAAAIVRMILESSGVRCCWARTVREALELIEDPASAFALALVDIILVDGNGLEVVKAIRAEPRTQNTPVFLTSAMNRNDVSDAACADGYMRKPFNAAALLNLVNDALKRHDSGKTVFLDNEGLE